MVTTEIFKLDNDDYNSDSFETGRRISERLYNFPFFVAIIFLSPLLIFFYQCYPAMGVTTSERERCEQTIKNSMDGTPLTKSPDPESHEKVGNEASRPHLGPCSGGEFPKEAKIQHTTYEEPHYTLENSFRAPLSPFPPRVVTLNVYATPYAFTPNNEPLYLRYGTLEAAEAADAAFSIICTDKTMKSPSLGQGKGRLNMTSRVQSMSIPTSSAQTPRDSREIANRKHMDEEDQCDCSYYIHPKDGGRDQAGNQERHRHIQCGSTARRNSENTTVLRTPVIQGSRKVTILEAPDQSTQKDSPDSEVILVDRETIVASTNKSGRQKSIITNPVSTDPLLFHKIEGVSRCNAVSPGYKRSSPSPDCETKIHSKRSRMVWSLHLHKRFLAAVNKINLDKAVPTTILQEMRVEGVTRENVASHLQKHRGMLKKEKDEEERSLLVQALAEKMTGASSTHVPVTEEMVINAVKEESRP